MPGKQRAKPRLTKKEKKAQTLALVNSAKDTPDLLSKLHEWTVYKKLDLDLKIEYSNSKKLDVSDLNQIFELLKKNMRHLYEKSDWGWNEDNKMAELSHEDARYLLIKDTEGKIVGFTHFRFDVEMNYPILYCYELQVDNDFQRKGLGRHVMNILFLLAHQFKLLKIVLTVFKDNIAGMNFYMKTLGFGRDETCPYDEEGTCYIILRKSIDKNEINAIKL